MLESVNLSHLLLKEEFDAAIKPLRARLSVLQQQIKQQKIPVVMVFEGWGASGKGSLISELILNFDPRGFKVFSCVEPTQAELRKPVLARYWENIPENGNIAVFDRSWYREVSVEPVDNHRSPEEVEKLYREINIFERQLADGGYLILKFFLHISKGEQKKRFQHLEDSPITAWRVTKNDWKHHKDYDKYYEAFDQMLVRTHMPYAPWQIIESEDRRWAAVKALRSLSSRWSRPLKRKSRRCRSPCPHRRGGKIPAGGYSPSEGHRSRQGI